MNGRVEDGLEVHPELLHDRFRLGHLKALVVIFDSDEQMANALLAYELEASVKRVAVIQELDIEKAR